MSEARPLYAVLGVPADATAEQIKAAYRRLALQHHPDKQGTAASTTELFSRIAFAYEVLSNVQRRKRYDLTGEVPQTDAALGKEASETFLAEYMKSAPKVARGVTNADMSLHSLDNYEILDVDSKDVPGYLRDIVKIGLGYLVTAVDTMIDKEVVLLRHFVMDQMYALLAYTPPLDAEAFSERGYIITYYDHPLQTGIRPSWSDHNGLDKAQSARTAERCQLKQIDEATMERRKLAALEWFGSPNAAAPSGAKAALPDIPGEGIGEERLQLAVRALLKSTPDPLAWDVHRLRRELEQLLRVDAHSLDTMGATALMSVVLEVMDEEPEENQSVPEAIKEPQKAAESSPAAVKHDTSGLTVGSNVLVRSSGRVGEVVMHDPDDLMLTYKVKFSDGLQPETDWCAAGSVDAAA
eukprot:TRINITY_DN91364_c0_g1_i1.p1 TRINITY_DN91364_c0_g1~~TRINITY_DN91364_c0_g1_i1.p1  ORF type:complete len:410 (+),score=105.99 TRINITY_DN91364_c0_g1_i1:53-1282(+)